LQYTTIGRFLGKFHPIRDFQYFHLKSAGCGDELGSDIHGMRLGMAEEQPQSTPDYDDPALDLGLKSG